MHLPQLALAVHIYLSRKKERNGNKQNESKRKPHEHPLRKWKTAESNHSERSILAELVRGQSLTTRPLKKRDGFAQKQSYKEQNKQQHPSNERDKEKKEGKVAVQGSELPPLKTQEHESGNHGNRNFLRPVPAATACAPFRRPQPACTWQAPLQALSSASTESGTGRSSR